MDELIKEFENKMLLEGKSDTTIKSYVKVADIVGKFVARHDLKSDRSIDDCWESFDKDMIYALKYDCGIEVPLKNICGVDIELMRKSMPVYQKEMAKCFSMAVASGLVYLLADSFTKD